jgi:hypothetical protein
MHPTPHAKNILDGCTIAIERDLLDHLAQKVELFGSQAETADKYGISTAYLNDVLHGRRPVSENLARKLGWTRVVVFARFK